MKVKKDRNEAPAKGLHGFIFTHTGHMTFRVYGEKHAEHNLDFKDYDVHQGDLQVKIVGRRYASLYMRPPGGDGNMFVDYPRKVLSAGGRSKRVPYEGYTELDARGTEGRLYLNGDGRHWDLAVKLRCTEPKCGCGGTVLQTLYYHVCHDDLEVEIIDGHAATYEVDGKEFIDLSSAAMRVSSKEDLARAVEKGKKIRQKAARYHPDKFFDCH